MFGKKRDYTWYLEGFKIGIHNENLQAFLGSDII